jgi:hypothetical protein
MYYIHEYTKYGVLAKTENKYNSNTPLHTAVAHYLTHNHATAYAEGPLVWHSNQP